MDEMLDLIIVFDSEALGVSQARPGKLLVDVRAILAVSEVSEDSGVCRIILSSTTRSHEDGRAMNRCIMVRAGFDEIRSLLAATRKIISFPRRDNSVNDTSAMKKMAKTIAKPTVTQEYINVRDGWYVEQDFFLPSYLIPFFKPGYKFHIDAMSRVCANWKVENLDQNYTLDQVEFNDNKVSICMTSERDMLKIEDQSIKNRLKLKAVALAKELISAGRGAVDMAVLEATVQNQQSKLTPKALEVFRRYIDRVPARLGPLAGNHMFNGKSFEEAVQLGSASLILASQKKLVVMLANGKNRRSELP